MRETDDASVDLVVTSPPYPMIEMWDEALMAQTGEARAAFEAENYNDAFDAMHRAALRPVWEACFRALKEGGVLCVNIGDAVRTLGGDFRLFPNHARVAADCRALGFTMLPGILWRKATNKPNKFMGSGMIAPNAYVTLEHEHILIFRKGEKRRVKSARRQQRYESAYFWEERNRWFSDVWTDLTGVRQQTENGRADVETSAVRERSAAFPLALPLRLIAMYSIYGDTVLDPFLGTGTTAVAAAMLGRSATGYEIDEAFATLAKQRIAQVDVLSREHNRARIQRHLAFLSARDDSCAHHNDFYDFGVVTRQEARLRLYDAEFAGRAGAGSFSFTYQAHPVRQDLLAVPAS